MTENTARDELIQTFRLLRKKKDFRFSYFMRRPVLHVTDDFTSQFAQIAFIQMHISERVDIWKCQQVCVVRYDSPKNDKLIMETIECSQNGSLH